MAPAAFLLLRGRFADADMIRFTALVTGLLLILAPMAATADDYVVIESSVPALPAGATVAAGAALDVPARGRVVLVSASGKVVTVNGPFQGSPPAGADAGQPASGDILKILPTLLNDADRRQSLGAVRGVDSAWRSDAVTTPADALAIDATDGGDACVDDPSRAELMHNPANSGTMTIQAMGSGASVALDWQKDAVRLPWPATLPLTDGDQYLFEQASQDGAAIVTIHLLPAAPSAGFVERAARMAAAGCTDQARLLLAAIAKTAH